MDYEDRLLDCLYERFCVSRDISVQFREEGPFFISLTKYRKLHKKMEEKWGEGIETMIFGDKQGGYFLVARKEYVAAQRAVKKATNS